MIKSSKLLDVKGNKRSCDKPQTDQVLAAIEAFGEAALTIRLLPQQLSTSD